MTSPRRLTPEDLDALEALERETATPRSRGQLATALADDAARLLGVVESGAVAGYAQVVRLPFDAELQGLLVAGPWRRRGLGGRLLAAVIAQARGWGSECLLLEVRAGNERALRLYRRAGFGEDGRRRGYYPPAWAGAPREDAVLMSLPLR